MEFSKQAWAWNSLTEERMQLIQVLYLNDRGGPVDDITLDELIRSQKIKHFYRPSEERWVDIFIDPVRGSGHAHSAEGLKRRYADREEDSERSAREEKPGGLFRGVLMRLKKHPPRKTPGAEEWLERGLSTLRKIDDRVRAARAFALSIRLNPRYQEAYLHRGLVYEALGNLQQAIQDYSMAIVLDPKDGKAHNGRGLVLEHPDMTVKAIAGLRRASFLRPRRVRPLLTSRTEPQEALQAPTERGREWKVSDAEAEGFPEAAGDLQRLIEKYRKGIIQLEAQVEEVKHKLDIVVEASRLLEEEGLARHRTLAHKAVPLTVLLVCASVLYIGFHHPAELIVPAEVEPAGQQQVDRVQQSLLKLGAPLEKVEELAIAIKSASASTQVSPILLVALMYTENASFDYKAVSDKGYKGLMQTPWASMRWADVDILLGAKILQEKLKLTGNDLLEALRLYKGGKNPTATRQAKRTMTVYEDLLKEQNAW
jgi:tetratricopeptide (TPR) repeat protein